MKIQKLVLMALMTMITCAPQINAMCRLGTRPVIASLALGTAVRSVHTTAHTANTSDGSDHKKYSFSGMFKSMRNNKKKIIAGLLIADDALSFKNDKGIAYDMSQKGFRQTLQDIQDVDIQKQLFDLESEKRMGKLFAWQGQELLDVFEELKTRMGAPKNYKLYRSLKPTEGAEAAFCACQALMIILAPNFFDLSLSEQVRCLCHELQHTKQEDFKIAQSFICNDEYYRDERSKNAEQDAETTAACMITCAQCLKDFAMPIEERLKLQIATLDAKGAFSGKAFECLSLDHDEKMKIIYEKSLELTKENISNMPSRGYFIPSDYEPYLQKALKNDKPCKAHAQGEISHDVRDYLPQVESK